MIGAALLLAAAAAAPATEATMDAGAISPRITPIRPHSHIHAGEHAPGEGPIVFDLSYRRA
jgi:hypothetical protein